MEKTTSKHKGDSKISEILLLEKGKRGVLRMLFGRTGIVIAILLAQIVLLVNIFMFLESVIPFMVGTLLVFTLSMVIYVMNSDHGTNVMLAWIATITLLPGFGGVLYIIIQKDVGHRALKKRLKTIIKESQSQLVAQKNVKNNLKKTNKSLYNLSTYTESAGGYPIYEGAHTQYFPIGEEAFEAMLSQLEKAEKYIFMEYFIIDEGYMWGRILKILADKAKQGVEVRLMYDGTCEFALLPHNYPKKIQALGIACKMFAPIRPFLSTHYNYRDHRKILVVDGNVAFTGGINLADEYINKKEVYGHWKDTAIMVQGEAVNSFTMMFLQMWNVNEGQRHYMQDKYRAKPLDTVNEGYVLPFGDSPLDSDKVGEMIYMDIINRAKDYVHIMTPYLILDGEMLSALKFAAKRGVDVKIILPHIPDKKMVFAQSRSYYAELIKSGVQIYEYTPGFIHAKVFVSDDVRSVVGTINLDYRSLYHHFECALYMEETTSIADVEKDFIDTMQRSQCVTLTDIKEYNIFMKATGRILKLFAPLM